MTPSLKITKELGWKPLVKFDELVKIMIESDLEQNKKELYLKNGGYNIKNFHE